MTHFYEDCDKWSSYYWSYHFSSTHITYPTLSPMTSDNATDQCVTAPTGLPVHALRKAGVCVTGMVGLPVEVAGLLEGPLKHILESQLKHYEARYLKLKSTTYNYS